LIATLKSRNYCKNVVAGVVVAVAVNVVAVMRAIKKSKQVNSNQLVAGEPETGSENRALPQVCGSDRVRRVQEVNNATTTTATTTTTTTTTNNRDDSQSSPSSCCCNAHIVAVVFVVVASKACSLWH